jgi:uncharacterized membrane protein
MAYCVQCGNQVGDQDRFCGKCGAQQAVRPAPVTDPLSRMNNKDAATLCYTPWVGWIAAIVVLASKRFRTNHQARFHAFQGLYLFVSWLLIDWVIEPIFAFSAPFPIRHISGLLKLGVLVAWIFMMVKVRHGEDYRLPVLGELADRSAHEQHA